MKAQTQYGLGTGSQPKEAAELDLVVPFTTPELTRAALQTATRMGAGLKAAVRLVKVQPVPRPLDLNQSPVYLGFLQEQLAQFQSELPISREIFLVREFEPGLAGILRPDSVVVLATRKRPWRTRNERLAARLRREGYVVLLTQDSNPTVSTEAEKCSTSSTVC